MNYVFQGIYVLFCITCIPIVFVLGVLLMVGKLAQAMGDGLCAAETFLMDRCAKDRSPPKEGVPK